jgi:S-formylglutathione hydrolase FrmB
MVLAMPSDGLFGDGSAYVPHKSGDYESWIVQDVVRAVKERNAQVDDSSPVFITGLSMGGFGALRLGAKYPDLFHGFSGLSSLTHFNQMNLFLENFEDLKNHALQQDGVLDWMSANKTKLSPFRFDCGSKDFLLEQNRVLHNSLLELGIPHLYEENEGKHEWDYWTKHIDTSFVFFDSLIS